MTKADDSKFDKLADSGVRLTDAEQDRVIELAKARDVTFADAVEKVLDERVGPAARTVQSYPDVAGALSGATGSDEPGGGQGESVENAANTTGTAGTDALNAATAVAEAVESGASTDMIREAADKADEAKDAEQPGVAENLAAAQEASAKGKAVK